MAQHPPGGHRPVRAGRPGERTRRIWYSGLRLGQAWLPRLRSIGDRARCGVCHTSASRPCSDRVQRADTRGTSPPGACSAPRVCRWLSRVFVRPARTGRVSALIFTALPPSGQLCGRPWRPAPALGRETSAGERGEAATSILVVHSSLFISSCLSRRGTDRLTDQRSTRDGHRYRHQRNVIRADVGTGYRFAGLVRSRFVAHTTASAPS